MVRGWRGLGLFWAALVVLVVVAAGTIEALGPPPHAPAPRVAEAPPRPAPPPLPATPTRVAAPDPALLERSATIPGTQLPRIAADGRMPRTAYAAPAPAAARAGQPRIAVLVSGFGLAERDSQDAIDRLPGPVAFAVSAYALTPPAMLEAARLKGHELLAAIPMEPQGYPGNDEGPRSLLTGAAPNQNRDNLEYVLGRTQGAVGATAASDGMRGERFADLAALLDPVLDEVARRGLLYIDPRPGRTVTRPNLVARGVDVVIDERPLRAEMEAQLSALERIAREKGAALGLAGPPRPITVERIAAWAQSLESRGIALVPVSALAKP